MAAGTGDWQRLAGSLAGRLDLAPSACDRVASDASGLSRRPEAVVRPADRADLVRLVEWAGATRTPVVARGGGTSLDGESVPIEGGVVVDLSGWDHILEIDPIDGVARVEPGVVNRSLDRALRPLGWMYPVNPGSSDSCTIGGNVATNASGPRSYRYGPTRHWVRALEVVDGRARSWTAGGRWAKASLGPDLLALLVGSEGTLGLFAEITVRIAVRPARRTGMVLPVPPEAGLGGFVREMAEALGAGGSAIEYVDQATAEALRAEAGRDWRGDRGLLLAETEGSEDGEEAALARIEALATRSGIADEVSIYPDADRLWEIRGKAGPALERATGPSLREDVVVPMAQLDALHAAVEGIARRHGVPVRIFGHVGQGNLHPNFAIDPASPEAERIRADLVEAARALGGALSGEHGVGRTKRAWTAAQWGAPGAEALAAVKATLDPLGILNPGKLWPPPSGSPSAAAAPRTPTA